jgi:hypothetical protein
MKYKLTLAVIISMILISTYASAITVKTINNNDNKISSVQNTLNENTLYVGGSGPGNYTRIQDAIDDSSNGDTIFVYNGTYNENIEIKKKIDLIGEFNQNTIINGQYVENNVVTIFADEVNISNFTIQNSSILDVSGPFHAGIGIYSNYTTIKNNIITKNPIGIKICSPPGIYYACYNNTIVDNLLLDNGIQVYSSFNNSIINNTFINEISHMVDGGGIFLVSSSNNIICRNKLSGRFSSAICLQSRSNKNNIHHNNIENKVQGNLLAEGIDIFNSNFNKIHHNNIKNCTIKALHIKSWFNIWYRNYWGRPRILPKIVFGTKGLIGLIPCFTIDIFTSRRPNVID